MMDASSASTLETRRRASIALREQLEALGNTLEEDDIYDATAKRQRLEEVMNMEVDRMVQENVNYTGAQFSSALHEVANSVLALKSSINVPSIVNKVQGTKLSATVMKKITVETTELSQKLEKLLRLTEKFEALAVDLRTFSQVKFPAGEAPFKLPYVHKSHGTIIPESCAVYTFELRGLSVMDARKKLYKGYTMAVRQLEGVATEANIVATRKEVTEEAFTKRISGIATDVMVNPVSKLASKLGLAAASSSNSPSASEPAVAKDKAEKIDDEVFLRVAEAFEKKQQTEAALQKVQADALELLKDTSHKDRFIKAVGNVFDKRNGKGKGKGKVGVDYAEAYTRRYDGNFKLADAIVVKPPKKVAPKAKAKPKNWKAAPKTGSAGLEVVQDSKADKGKGKGKHKGKSNGKWWSQSGGKGKGSAQDPAKGKGKDGKEGKSGGKRSGRSGKGKP